jgi:hypothetical protein
MWRHSGSTETGFISHINYSVQETATVIFNWCLGVFTVHSSASVIQGHHLRSDCFGQMFI